MMHGELSESILRDGEFPEAARARRIGRAGIMIMAIAALGVAGWTVLAPLTGAVIAPGLIKVDMNRKTVQHQEGGIVREILVRDGDRVSAGQPLIVLNDVRVDAGYELLRTQLDAESARNARLLAERAFAPRIAFPRDLRTRSADARVGELLQREAALFTVRREVLESQIRLLHAQVGETHAEIKARLEQETADDRAIQLQQEEIDANVALKEQGYVSKTRLLTLERIRAEYETRRGENQAELARARQKISELELRALMLRNQYMQQAADELKESTTRLFDLQERLRPSEDAAQRQRIVAPVAGEIVELKVTTVGAVIGPRESLLDIVPENPRLLVEAHIRPEDINSVRIGSEADVRLTAFKNRITPLVTGAVVYVSGDRIAGTATEPAHYVVRVEIPPESLAAAGDLRLQAGMPAEVFVKTSPRTPLQYWIDPIIGYMQRAGREP